MTEAESAQWALPGPFYGFDRRELKEPYSQHTWVYTCVDDLATKICSVPLNLYTGKKATPRVITSGPLYEIFRRPNGNNSGNDLTRATITLLMPQGNAIWLMDRATPRDVPREIWCLSYQYFTPKYYPGTWNISHWEMHTQEGKQITNLPTHNVVFFKLYNPYSQFWGLSPLQAAEQALEQDWLAILLNRNFFENGAMPGGILTIKSSNSEKRKRYQEWFDTKYTGAAKAFRTLVLQEGDASFQQAQLSHDDMQFIQLRKMSRDEICAVYHVPVSEVGVQENIHKATDKNVTRKYWAGPLKAIMRLMVDDLQAQFFAPFDGEKTWIDFDLSSVEALQEAEEVRWDKAFKAWNMGWPAKHCNERWDLRMKPFSGWDVSYIPAGMVRADMLGGKNGNGLGGEDINPQISEPNESDVSPDDYKAILGPQPQLVYTTDQDRAIKRWVSRQTKVSREFERDIRDYMNEAKKELEKAIAGYFVFAWAAEILSLRGEAAFDLPPAFDMALRDIMTGHFKRIGAEIGPIIEEHIAQAGISYAFDLNAPAIKEFLEQKIIAVTGINERMKVAIRKRLIDAAHNGKTVKELSEDIVSVVDISRERAQTIAQTETQQVANGAEYRAYQLAGVTYHQWMAILDGRARRTHEEMMALGPWPVGQMFPNGCFYPGDYTGPPEEVISCRCGLQAVK